MNSHDIVLESNAKRDYGFGNPWMCMDDGEFCRVQIPWEKTESCRMDRKHRGRRTLCSKPMDGYVLLKADAADGLSSVKHSIGVAVSMSPGKRCFYGFQLFNDQWLAGSAFYEWRRDYLRLARTICTRYGNKQRVSFCSDVAVKAFTMSVMFVCI